MSLIITPSGDAFTANPLSQFAATNSAQLAGVMSDEVGTGNIAFNTNTVLVTPDFTTGFSIGGGAVSGKVIIGDGTNFVSSTPAYPIAASNVGKLIQSDGTNFITSLAAWPSGAAPVAGKIIRSDGTNWVASTPTIPTTAGTNGNLWVSDGTNMVSAPRTMQQQNGTSTSGTNGTVIALMTAAAGNQLVNFLAQVGQTTAANTNARINIVYSDGTSTTANSVYNQPVQMIATYGGIMAYQSAQWLSTTALSAKKVTSINITTMGAGGGTRGATITAEEIPMS